MNLDLTFAPGTALAGDDVTVGRLVDQLMTRVPPSTDRSALEQAGRRAAVDVRLRGGGFAHDADVESAVRTALLVAVRGLHAWGEHRAGQDAAPHTAVTADAHGTDRLADLVATLPPLQRRVVEGYFVAVREVTELADELGLTVAELVATRRDALLTLRDTYLVSA